jgi:hypothetical protein
MSTKKKVVKSLSHTKFLLFKKREKLKKYVIREKAKKYGILPGKYAYMVTLH